MAGGIEEVTIFLDEGEMQAAQAILEPLGISLGEYLRLAVKRLVAERRVPFGPEAAENVPNAETMRAIVEAEAKAFGLIEDDARSFDNAEDAIAYLESI